MPLDCENPIDSDLVTDYVSPEKDVDGLVVTEKYIIRYKQLKYSFCSLHTINEGRTAINSKNGFIPCTPHGCIELIKRSGISMVGAKAVVLGK